MDKAQTINAGFEKLDYIFISVKKARMISANELFRQHSEELTNFGVNESALNIILAAMEKQEYLLKDEVNGYYVNPLNPEFLSFKHKFLQLKAKKKNNMLVDLALRLLPIALTLIFGVITALISYSNYNLSRQKSVNNDNKIILVLDSAYLKKNQKIDTLYLMIKR